MCNTKARQFRLPKPPSRLSALVRLALDTAKELDREDYSPRAGVWHLPDSQTCWICLAGMVMAGPLGIAKSTEIDPRDDRLKRWRPALYALDAVKDHELIDAFEKFYGVAPSAVTIQKLASIPEPEATRVQPEDGGEGADWLGWGEFDEWAEEARYVAHMLALAGV